MKLLVLGNINAGKTTAIMHLEKLFPTYPVFKIDEYRKKYGDGTKERDSQLTCIFVQDVVNSQNAIIEICGKGLVGELLKESLPANSLVNIIVITDKQLCLDRIKIKNFTITPYPKYEETLEETISRLDQEFRDKIIENFWNEQAIVCYRVNGNQDIDNQLRKLPLFHYEELFEFIYNIRKLEVNELIAFGSLGRQNLSLTSDIDLILTTNRHVNYIFSFLQEKYSQIVEIKYLDNKIIIYTPIIIEIFVVKNITSMSQYFCTSGITNLHKTMFIYNKTTLEVLTKILQEYHYSLEEDIQYTTDKIFYFFKSLTSLLNVEDNYKFYFHSNIITHELIRLKALQGKHYQNNYLPKFALNLLTDDEIEKMFFYLKKDMKQHIKDIEEIISRLL